MSKGMELPINMIVVVLIAVLVLTTVGIFLTRQLGGGASNIDYQAAWGKACTQLRFQYNCDENSAGSMDLRADQSVGSPITFLDACRNAVGPGLTPQQCAAQCGC